MTKVSTFKYCKFSEDESGAVTVDWVVLTGVVIGLAFVTIIPVFSATEGASDIVNTTLLNATQSASEID